MRKRTAPRLQSPQRSTHSLTQAVLNFDTPAQLLQLYREVSIKVGLLVLHKLQDHKRADPLFDSKDHENFRTAIEDIKVFDIKVAFFLEKGFKAEWGSPSEVPSLTFRSS